MSDSHRLLPLASLAGGTVLVLFTATENGFRSAVSALDRVFVNELSPKEAMRPNVLAGCVTYDGEPPEASPLKGIQSHKDRGYCLRGAEFEKRDQTWIVDKASRGVANVVIWLEPLGGRRFDLRPEDLKVKDQEIDQPHCAFVPHVITMFPVYRQGSRYVRTGQKLVVHNSGVIPHCPRVVEEPPRSSQRSPVLPPKGKTTLVSDIRRSPCKSSATFIPG